MTQNIVIFGNSGSGKSTLAQHLVKLNNLAHLDLDTIAWLPTNPPQRQALDKSCAAIRDFIEANDSWVIEGCYSDLLEWASAYASNLIFLNLPVELCLENAKSRPWEPHKYQSKEAQDANLAMLLDWIAEYEKRDDHFSKQAHLALFDAFSGAKVMINSKLDLQHELAQLGLLND